MPLLEKIIAALIFFAFSAMIWECLKLAYASRKERNHTWIAFDDLKHAQEAAELVDHYHVSLDNGKRAEARVTWLRTNAKVEILVPNAMLALDNFSTARDRFRSQVQDSVMRKAMAAND